jgi:hypothetical protein
LARHDPKPDSERQPNAARNRTNCKTQCGIFPLPKEDVGTGEGA